MEKKNLSQALSDSGIVQPADVLRKIELDPVQGFYLECTQKRPLLRFDDHAVELEWLQISWIENGVRKTHRFPASDGEDTLITDQDFRLSAFAMQTDPAIAVVEYRRGGIDKMCNIEEAEGFVLYATAVRGQLHFAAFVTDGPDEVRKGAFAYETRAQSVDFIQTTAKIISAKLNMQPNQFASGHDR